MNATSLPTLTPRGRNAALALLGLGYLLLCREVHAGLLTTSAPLCPFHWLTGIDCPLCGLSRAFGCLLTGNAVAALRYHPDAPELFTLWVTSTALTAVHSLIARGPCLRPGATSPDQPYSPDLTSNPLTPPPSH